jgi:hypothetical protein
LPGHSAHIGQEAEIHYRWHPLHGRRVKVCSTEQRGTGQFVYVEAAAGVVTLIPAWMLDPVVCAAMANGAPRVTVRALVDLHHLLVEGGLRASSQDDLNIVQEERSDQIASIATHNPASAAEGITPAQHCVRFHPASRDEPVGAREGARASGDSLAASRQRGNGGA